MTEIKSTVGICDMALYVPKLYLPIEKLAEVRGLDYPKLNKGLGLSKMSIPDVHEDVATMGANAIVELMERNGLKPEEIGRIYLGTESALDGSKPTATYILEMLRRKYRSTHGVDCFQNCDVVDLTFACIGGVDALQNSLDWVKGDERRIGIVVTSDFAKYELASGGEYTQGAGAIALLVKHNPRLLSIYDNFGVATRGVHDFYKPMRSFLKKEIIDEIINLANINDITAEDVLQELPTSLTVEGILDDNDEILKLHKETPVFDGQYSNWTYQNRIREAYQHFCKSAGTNTDFISQWERLIFHLPYAFHGKRIASELFMFSQKAQGKWGALSVSLPPEPVLSNYDSRDDYEKDRSMFLRAITKTEAYKIFVTKKLEKAQRASTEIGNMYTCSIFLALMSTLESDLHDGSDLTDETIGFFAYGSGSKSKVFQGKIQPQWKEVVSRFHIFDQLEHRTEINYTQYEQLHRKQLSESILLPKDEFILERKGTEGVRIEAKYYAWKM